MELHFDEKAVTEAAQAAATKAVTDAFTSWGAQTTLQEAVTHALAKLGVESAVQDAVSRVDLAVMATEVARHFGDTLTRGVTVGMQEALVGLLVSMRLAKTSYPMESTVLAMREQVMRELRGEQHPEDVFSIQELEAWARGYGWSCENGEEDAPEYLPDTAPARSPSRLRSGLSAQQRDASEDPPDA